MILGQLSFNAHMEGQQGFISFACFRYCFLGCLSLLRSCNAIETPQYTVVRSEQDVEIRLYEESSWMSSPVRGGTTFEKSTEDGFHRLYQYLHGGNLNSSQLPMTTPVLTSIPTPPANESNYVVRLYLSPKYDGAIPQPYPELNLAYDKWNRHCVAVRKFSGFAKDDNINREVEALATTLDKIIIARREYMSYTIAQYNASRHLLGRLNEVWTNVSGFKVEGCPY